MLDIHSDQQIFLEEPELYLPERKSAKGPSPKKLKASTVHTTAFKYIGSLEPADWKAIDIRHSAKGVLKGLFHFRTVYIWDKNTNTWKTGYWWCQNEKPRTGKKSNTPSPMRDWGSTPNRPLPTCRHSGSL